MDITKEDFQDYEAIRQSGFTNMFDIKQVIELSGLDKDMILEIMGDYGNLADKYK